MFFFVKWLIGGLYSFTGVFTGCSRGFKGVMIFCRGFKRDLYLFLCFVFLRG